MDEHTGKLIEIKSDCIILEGVVCAADYHRFCPRGIYSYWREIWLERVDNSTGNGSRPHTESGRGIEPPQFARVHARGQTVGLKYEWMEHRRSRPDGVDVESIFQIPVVGNRE